MWCAFVSARQRDPLRPYSFANYEEGDFIVVRRKTDGEWSDELVVSDYFGVNFQPVIAESANGDIVVVWTGRRRGRFALYSRRIGRDLSLGSETEILTAGQLEGEPAVVADAGGRILLAAESYRRNSMDIVSYVLEGSGWRQLPDVSSSAAPEFRPRLAKGPAGEIYCAWDAYEDGRYRVKLSRYDGGAKNGAKRKKFRAARCSTLTRPTRRWTAPAGSGSSTRGTSSKTRTTACAARSRAAARSRPSV